MYVFSLLINPPNISVKMARKEKASKREDARRSELKHLAAMLREAESRADAEDGEAGKLKVRAEFAKMKFKKGQEEKKKG